MVKTLDISTYFDKNSIILMFVISQNLKTNLCIQQQTRVQENPSHFLVHPQIWTGP